MRSSIAIVISSILISGCTLMSFPAAPPSSDGIYSVVTVPHPKLAPVKYESCAGYAACFTNDELNQLGAEIAELKKEAGR